MWFWICGLLPRTITAVFPSPVLRDPETVHVYALFQLWSWEGEKHGPCVGPRRPDWETRRYNNGGDLLLLWRLGASTSHEEQLSH